MDMAVSREPSSGPGDGRATTPSFRAVSAALLRRILDSGPCTITELADGAKVSRPTVRRGLDHLEHVQLVSPAGHRVPESGRPAEEYELGPGEPRVVGVDVRPTSTHLTCLSTTGRFHGRRDLHHDDIDDEHRLSGLLAAIDDLRQDGAAPLAIVLGIPGIVGADGSVLLSRMVPSWTGLALRERVTARFPTAHVRIENDMNLRALAEMHGGAAEGLADFVYLTDHGWLRPAVVLGGEVRHGAQHVLGEDNGLARAGVVPRMLRHGSEEWLFRDVALDLEAGRLDNSWLVPFHRAWADVLHVIRYLLDPEAVIIDGPPATTGTAELEDLRDRLAEHCTIGETPKILAGRRGEDVTLSGALTLALRDALRVLLQVEDPPVPPIHDGTTTARKGRA